MLADMDKDIEITSEEEVEISEASETLEEEAKTEEAAEACETSEDAAKAEEGDKKKSKLFGKKKDKKDQMIEELNDKVIRQMAEFDNFRKRTEKEKSQMFDSGASTMVEKILPVVDDFERGLTAMSEADKESSFAQGMEMIYKKLMGILEQAGVTAIEAVGKEFDPNFHNAVMQTASEEYESGVIAQELQKGYMYKEKVIRHSMVIVAE